MRRIVKKLLPPSLRHALEARINAQKFGRGYLSEKAWFEGARSHVSVGHGGAPIPWITYPALEMLDRVLRPTWRLFEYGTGNSSLWYATKVSFVASVEHDPQWAEQVRNRAPGNLTVELVEKPAPDEHGFDDFPPYSDVPRKYGSGYFDVFVIDGMSRNLCAITAAELINPHGIVVWDNAERWHYNEGFATLAEQGWRRIDFYGPGPVQSYEWCTAIFCRDLDWLPTDLTIRKERRYPLR